MSGLANVHICCTACVHAMDVDVTCLHWYTHDSELKPAVCVNVYMCERACVCVCVWKRSIHALLSNPCVGRVVSRRLYLEWE